MKGHIDILKVLINQKGINVNLQADDGETALHLARRTGRSSVYEVLLEHPEIDPEIKNNNGNAAISLCEKGLTRLMRASYDGDKDQVMNLLMAPKGI